MLYNRQPDNLKHAAKFGGNITREMAYIHVFLVFIEKVEILDSETETRRFGALNF